MREFLWDPLRVPSSTYYKSCSSPLISHDAHCVWSHGGRHCIWRGFGPYVRTSPTGTYFNNNLLLQSTLNSALCTGNCSQISMPNNMLKINCTNVPFQLHIFQFQLHKKGITVHYFKAWFCSRLDSGLVHSSRWTKILQHFSKLLKWRCFHTEIEIYLSKVSVETLFRWNGNKHT